MTRLALIALALLALTGGSAGAGSSYRTPDCPAEDSCRVDYRAGGWWIDECEGACDDIGQRVRWQRVRVR